MGAVRDGWVFFQESLRLFLPFHSRPKPHLATSGLLVGLTLIIFSLAGCFNEVRPPIPLKSKGQTPAALSQKNWGELQKKLAALSYEINGSKDELWARDRQRGLRYHFLKDGLAIGQDSEKSDPKNWLSLRTLALGRPHQKQSIDHASWQKHGDFRVDRQTAQLTEWYVNSAEGLEQGYTISQKPQGQGDLWVEIELTGGTLSETGDNLQLHGSHGLTLNYRDLKAIDAKGHSLDAKFQIRDKHHLRMAINDEQAVYPLQIDPTITGSETIVTVAGGGVGDEGPATSAILKQPTKIVFDAVGDLYIADSANYRIRKVSNGIITTVVGNGSPGNSGDGSQATLATLGNVSSITLDATNNLYIADNDNHTIRKVSNGIITTIVEQYTLYSPSSLAIDAAGDLYIADASNAIYRFSNGLITRIVGSGEYGYSGDGGPATAATMSPPQGIAFDAAGDLYIADTDNHRIRKVSNGIITTVAGSGPIGYLSGGYSGDGGPATAAALNRPRGIAIDSVGDLYIADTGNRRIRRVSNGIITTVAGNGFGGDWGDGGPATAATLDNPTDIAIDVVGDLYIAEYWFSIGVIRKVSNGIITTVAGNNPNEYDTIKGYSSNGGPATEAVLQTPMDIVFNPEGDLYIADELNNVIRKVSNGIITTVAGSGLAGYSGDGGPATAATMFYPNGIAFDAAGDLYIADRGNNRIRKVSNGIITTVAGSGPIGYGNGGYSGDGGLATAAALNQPRGIAIDSVGDLYIADTDNYRIRRVSNGIITTIAGNGIGGIYGSSYSSSNDGNFATTVSIKPSFVSVDAIDDLYISDFGHRVLKVSNGIITTAAGNGDMGEFGMGSYSGDGGPATDAGLLGAGKIAFDTSGDFYIPDGLRIRKVSDGIITTIVGNGAGYSGDGGPAMAAGLGNARSIAFDAEGNMFIAENNRIREVSPYIIPTPPTATTPLAEATSADAAYVEGSTAIGCTSATVSSLQIYANSSLSLDSGTQLTANNGIFVDSGALFSIASGSTITGNIYNSGTIDVTLPVGCIGGGGGGGWGLINGGSFDINGQSTLCDFTQTASGQTLFHISGPTQGTEYSFLSVSCSAANLQGAFRVNLIPPYIPAHGAKFQIFEASQGISFGAFTMDLPSDFTWDIVNNGTVIELTYTGGSVLPSPKNLGTDCESCDPGMPGWSAGNPINTATGNKFQIETDFVGAPHTGLELRRFYNSQDTTATAFGANWHSTWQRSLTQPDSATVKISQANGRVDTFTYNGTAWASDADVTSRLSAVMNAGTQTGWQLVKDDDSIELYTLDGRLSSVTDRAGNVTTLTYDSSSRLSTVTGPFEHTLIFGYNADNLISDVTLPDNSHLSYGYDAAHNLTSVTYPGNAVRQYLYNESTNIGGADLPHAMTGIIDENHVRFANYKYDANNRAISTEHADGTEKVSVTYNADGTSSVKDALEHVHSYTLTPVLDVIKPTAISGAPVPSAGGKAFAYDANGNVTSHMDFNGNLDCHAYDLTRNLEIARVEGLAPGKTCPADPATYTPAAGSAERVILTQWHQKFRLPTQITEPSGVPGVNRVTTFAYDNTNGTLLTKTITAGALTRRWTYTYNSHGQVLTVDGPRTDVADLTTFTYDPAGNLATITNALNQVSQITSYNGNGFPLTIQDPNGLVTQLTYTPRGQIATRLVGQELTTYEYDDAEQLQKITLPDGSYLIYSYNDAHQLTGITDALGNHIAYTPDLAGNIVTEEVFDPNQTLVRTKSHVYDEVNRLAQDIGALNQTTDYGRDDNGNITSITDPNHNATTRTFDALNRLATRIDPQNGLTKLIYNPDNSLATVIDPRDVATQYAYDGLGNQTSMQSPDSGTTTRTFDAAGNIKTSTDARGITTTNTYDALNRLTKQVFGKNVSVTYAYDQGANGIGHLTTMTDPSGSTTWTYDQRGHVLTKKQKVGKITLTTAHVYDAVTGQLTAMTLPSGQVVNYQYDANGRPAALLAGATPIISAIAYEPFGPAQSWLQGSNATAHQRQFDLDGNLSGISFANSSISTTSGGVETIDLFRDPGSRITDIHDNTALPKTFGYDALDELISYANTSVTQNYDYDANGNRTLLTENANNSVYTIDPASNRLLKRSTNSTALTNYTLDEAGNLTNDGTRSFTIDARGKLASVKVGKTATNYDYNGFGERVQKSNRSIGTTLFTQDANGNITGEYDSKGKAIQEIIYLGSLPVGVLKSGTWYYVNSDHLGTPRTITDGAGNPVWSWDRDPFGNNQPTGTLGYNLRFPGQYYDAETGLHHNGFRDYDPMLGRYIESDPVGLRGGINTYAYVSGSPVNAVDTFGLSANINLFDPLSLHSWYASHYPSQPNTFIIAGHGGFHKSNNAPRIEDSKGNYLTPQDIADIVNKPGSGYIKGQRILLLSCHTGQNSPNGGASFAQLLSNILGTEVDAPNDTGWFMSDKNGMFYIAAPERIGPTGNTIPDTKRIGKIVPFFPE